MPICYIVEPVQLAPFNRQSLAIKASVSRPRFTWQFVFYSKPTSCVQFVKVFPSLPLGMGWRYRFAFIEGARSRNFRQFQH